MLAMEKGNYNVVMALLKAGADKEVTLMNLEDWVAMERTEAPPCACTESDPEPCNAAGGVPAGGCARQWLH